MFRRLALILVLAASATHAQGVSHHAGTNPGTAQGRHEPKGGIQPSDLAAIEGEIDRVARAIEAQENKQPSTEEKNEAKRNLEAQEKIAKWAPWVFWVALAELGITLAGVVVIWLTLTESRRTGRAQVRAYVSAKSVDFSFIDMGVGAQPTVKVFFQNTGNSPARRFGWNATVQYVTGKKKRTRTLIGITDRTKWARTHDIPARDIIDDQAIVSDMMIQQFATSPQPLAVIVRVRIDFIFEDVFKNEIVGEAYFWGNAQQVPSLDVTKPAWVGSVIPSHKPGDWDGPDSG